jgi:hypothetical protein
MFELRESPKTVQTRYEHSKIAITFDIYSHISSDPEKHAAAYLFRFIENSLSLA